MSTISDTLDKFEQLAISEVDRMSRAAANDLALGLDDVRKMDLLAGVLIKLEAHQNKRDKALVDGKTADELRAMLDESEDE